jgi:hypothetical protein
MPVPSFRYSGANSPAVSGTNLCTTPPPSTEPLQRHAAGLAAKRGLRRCSRLWRCVMRGDGCCDCCDACACVADGTGGALAGGRRLNREKTAGCSSTIVV